MTPYCFNDTLPETIESVESELLSIESYMIKLAREMSTRQTDAKFAWLTAEKKRVGFRHQWLLRKQGELRRRNRRDEQTTLEHVFMNTVLEMFDAADVAEIWDRVYAENPELRDFRNR